ncbi:MAG: hypothetical protein RLZZ246_139 [Planctomycetota bacterium]
MIPTTTIATLLASLIALAPVHTVLAQSTKPAPSKPSSTAAKGTTSTQKQAAKPAAAAEEQSKKQIFILPLEGTVGIQLRAKDMHTIKDMANAAGPGQIVIIKINSNGGLVLETPEIQAALMGIRDGGHRLVAWIEKAISGGAFTAMYAPEIYFMKTGSMGSITRIAGQGWVEQGAQEWEDAVARTCEMGGRSPFVGRAMVHAEDLLSYDIDPETGKVTFHDTLEGEFELSNAQENLTLNASNALKCKFSSGTADTLDDLLAAMGVPEGQYEVSEAGNKVFEKWKRTCEQCEKEVPELFRQYQLGGTGSGDGIVVLGKRIDAIKKLLEWWKKAPEMMRYEIRVPEPEQLEQQLEQLKYQQQQARKQRDGAGT